MTRLRHSSADEPGIRRVGRGRGFSYSWADGTAVHDADVLDRIRALAIPPAWHDVWICAWPNGHLQARGIDAAGRYQYRYHDVWRARRDAEKFARMLAFGRGLGSLRARVERDLLRDGVGRERVLAGATRLLDVASLRVGGKEYAHDHETYGLATLQKGHVRLAGPTVHLRFRAKTGREMRADVDDDDVAALLRVLKGRRGGDGGLFAWQHARHWRLMHSEDVNDYLKSTIGTEFSAKDFRTWNATVRCAVELATAGPPPPSPRSRRQTVNAALEVVAAELGNTIAVCRSSYVDPRVVEAFEEGETISSSARGPRRRAESQVLALCARRADR